MAKPGNKTDGLKYSFLNKNVLTPDETELFELASLAGVEMDASLFK